MVAMTLEDVMLLARSSKLAAIVVAAVTLIGTASSAFADNNQYTTGKEGRMGSMRQHMMMRNRMHYRHHYHHHYRHHHMMNRM